MIKQKIKKRKRGKKAVDLKPRWEDDYELVENEGLFAEYLEMGELNFLKSSFEKFFIIVCNSYLTFTFSIFVNLANMFSVKPFKKTHFSEKIVCHSHKTICNFLHFDQQFFNDFF